jgi:DNA invertase Pin-like site-specific DNA recombinase
MFLFSARRSRTLLAAVRARGRKGGRKAKLNEDQIKQIKALLKELDIKVTDIAKQYGVCRATIFNAVGPVKPERA